MGPPGMSRMDSSNPVPEMTDSAWEELMNRTGLKGAKMLSLCLTRRDEVKLTESMRWYVRIELSSVRDIRAQGTWWMDLTSDANT